MYFDTFIQFVTIGTGSIVEVTTKVFLFERIQAWIFSVPHRPGTAGVAPLKEQLFGY